MVSALDLGRELLLRDRLLLDLEGAIYFTRPAYFEYSVWKPLIKQIVAYSQAQDYQMKYGNCFLSSPSPRLSMLLRLA